MDEAFSQSLVYIINKLAIIRFWNIVPDPENDKIAVFFVINFNCNFQIVRLIMLIIFFWRRPAMFGRISYNIFDYRVKSLMANYSTGYGDLNIFCKIRFFRFGRNDIFYNIFFAYFYQDFIRLDFSLFRLEFIGAEAICLTNVIQ